MHALYYTIEFDKFKTTNFFHILKFLYYSVYFGLQPNLSNQLRKFYSLKCNLNIIKCVFESLEHKVINFVYRLNLKSITQNEVVYINRYDENDLSVLTKQDLIERDLTRYTQFRIISNNIINYNKNGKDKDEYFNFHGLNLRKEKILPSYNVIFFIHGGGFFAQSSEGHLDYLINWAKSTNAVIICIDYQLAPENKYPHILNENISAYKKFIMNSEKMFNFKIKKSMIVGDSGGGFFSLNIIKHSIINKIRTPDAAVFIYPATRMIFNSMSPSVLTGCRDNFLDPQLMANIQRVILDLEKNSISDYKNDDNLNFFLTDPKVISKFPRTLLICGSFDPLKDECYLLADFLLQNKVDVKFNEYLFYCHGFINLANMVDPYYKKGEEDIKNYILESFRN